MNSLNGNTLPSGCLRLLKETSGLSYKRLSRFGQVDILTDSVRCAKTSPLFGQEKRKRLLINNLKHSIKCK